MEKNHIGLWRQTWSVLNAALEMGVELVVSPLTLIEVLSKPDMPEPLLTTYAEFCQGTNEIEFRAVEIDAALAVRVGYHRRTTQVKVPDCLQFAFAERLGCDAILTNDRQYSRGPRRAIQVEDIDL